MQHYFLYIIPEDWSATRTKLYRVQIGTSKKENNIFLQLVAQSEEKGHFFHLWDADTAEFYYKSSLSLFGHPYGDVAVKGRDLLRALQAGDTLDESEQQRKRFIDFVNKQAHTDYEIPIFRAPAQNHAGRVNVKNLSK